MDLNKEINKLRKQFSGQLYTDETNRLIYSTDASPFKEKPVAIAWPANTDDIKLLISFAKTNNTSLIPRGAGTSLAGQVVGKGIVVDMSRYFNRILEVNKEEHWVKVEPGVVLDELNLHVKRSGLFFGPETSTSNRCVLGGMTGNNSCGSHSILYGSTRDHTLEIKAILSDGSEAVFKDLSKEEFIRKCEGDSLESKIYQHINEILSDKDNQKEIAVQYPDKTIKRRNTGYALDLLLDSEIFTDTSNEKFNFCKLICGSEGTLAFVYEIKLNLVPIPPFNKAVIAAHFNSKEDAFNANLVALKYGPGAVELLDDKTLALTEANIEQKKNRFFIHGKPAAVLIIELSRDSKEEITETAHKIIENLRKEGLGYEFPVIWGSDINKIWALRKAGLGLLSNMAGDAKPVSFIEDTAVAVEKLYDYIAEYDLILKKYKKECVYWAHIGSGELHLRPILNLKDKDDVELFHTIGYEVAKLVKKYGGSLSGEHGDGRLRGEFIPIMLGEKVYSLLKGVKKVWDPDNILNPGKITDTPRMNTQLRFEPGVETKMHETYFNFKASGGLIRAIEKCNGSGDCRKSFIIGGTMCPSFMATRDEQLTTRARANLLREFITYSEKKNPFNHQEIYEILDLCLSCKACKSECPSSVDMAKLKAEFLQHYYDSNRIPLRTRLIAHISTINKLASWFPLVFNFCVKSRILSGLIKKIIGFAQKRSIPVLYKTTLKHWVNKNLNKLNSNIHTDRQLYLFIDEFVNYNDTETGIKTIKLLNRLDYKIHTIKHNVSGRTFLSKGFLKKAKAIAEENINIFKNIISENCPLVGIEPSAILCFRDEYPDLVDDKLSVEAKVLADNVLLVEEFIAKELEKGNINRGLFTKEKKEIKLHGHCQQKAIASTDSTKAVLSIPENYMVTEIKSGCCGMAGSFGFEKEHYELSMKVGELVLFPEVRKTAEEVKIAASGTSCRHQIFDGTGRKALHPVEILFEALL